MTGQGSPTSSRRLDSKIAYANPVRWCADLVFMFVVALFVIQCVSPPPAAAQFSQAASPEPVSDVKEWTIGTRISWGGATNESWLGQIEVQSGTMTEARSLAMTSDAPGGVQLKNSTVVSIHERSPTNYGGADVIITGSADTTISVTLYPADRPNQKFESKIQLGQILESPYSETIDTDGNQLNIARKPGDQIQVSVQQDSLVYAPGEFLSLRLKPNLTGIRARTVNCRVKIVPARKLAPVVWSNSFQFSIDQSGSGKNERLEVPVPGTEGVYDVLLELEPNWYQVPFNNKNRSVTRKVQLVVLGSKSLDQSAKETTASAWRQFDLIDVTSGRSIARNQNGLASFGPFSVDRPLGNEQRSTVLHQQQPMMQLQSGGWHAIQLPVDQIGKPHIVEIEYLDSPQTTFGVSVIQPDQLGQVSSIGFDSGVAVPNSIVESELSPQLKKHRVTYWPSNKQPFLLLANRHATEPSTLGNIRIMSGPDRLSLAKPNSGSSGNRKHMAFYEIPLFADNFGADKYIDPQIRQPIDDWLTFYVGADRLIQYLKANAYNGAYITVATDGSSIYPSNLLAPSSKYDSGSFASSGYDPHRKDVVELLLRMFEREGLKLVPTLAFSAPLPEVEAARDPNRLANDFELIDFRQQSASSVSSDLPMYNPLNLLVQRSVTRVVEEFAQRYAKHESLDSIAVSCRPDTYTQLMGQQWCYDEETINRFLSSLPDNPDASTVRNELLTTKKDQWLNWRADQMAGWYDEMVGAVQRHIADGKLVLAPTDLYRNEEISSALSPSLHLQANFDEIMNRMGFNNGFAGRRDDVIILKPTRTAPSQSLASQRVESQIENSRQSVEFYKQASYPGSVQCNRMSWAHFAEFQQQSPFGSQLAPLMRLQLLSPSDYWNREHAATSLRDLDSRLLLDGGMILATGQQESLKPFMEVFNQLPDQQFISVESTQLNAGDNPVAVRQAVLDGEWYFYAVNSSPWSVSVSVTLKGNASAIQSFSDTKFVEQADDSEQADNSNRMQLTLQPFGLAAGSSKLKNQIELNDFTIQFPENASQPLRSQLNKLQLKLAKANKTRPLDVLSNTDFSPGGQATLNGWNLGQQPATNVRLEKNKGRDNSAGLSLASTGQTVWIRSNQFSAPTTGRISVSVWLRTDNPDEQPPLRLAIEGRTENSDYYRFGSIGALAPASEAKRVDSKWQQFAVHFDDLPTQRLENLRIGFDLMGPGRVWIDDIEVYDRWFDGNDAKAITQMLATVSLLLSKPENAERCRRILNSYWPRFLDENFPSEPESIPESQMIQPMLSPITPVESAPPPPRRVETQKRPRNVFSKHRRR